MKDIKKLKTDLLILNTLMLRTILLRTRQLKIFLSDEEMVQESAMINKAEKLTSELLKKLDKE